MNSLPDFSPHLYIAQHLPPPRKSDCCRTRHSGGAIVRAACNAHARRKFEDAKDYPSDRKKWMDWFWLLYDMESEAAEQQLTGEALLASRRAKQQPVWSQMRAELDSIDHRTKQVVLPKSDLRKALNYIRNHWAELTRYLSDPQRPLDNNECEQLMRQVALGRKNWLVRRKLDRRRAQRWLPKSGQQRPPQRS